MNIYTEDEALIELLEVGCTNDKRYKRLPKDVIKGYIKAYNHLRAAKRIEDLFRIGSLHYERLKGDLKDFESVRCTGRWRLIFKSSTIDLSLIHISEPTRLLFYHRQFIDNYRYRINRNIQPLWRLNLN